MVFRLFIPHQKVLEPTTVSTERCLLSSCEETVLTTHPQAYQTHIHQNKNDKKGASSRVRASIAVDSALLTGDGCRQFVLSSYRGVIGVADQFGLQMNNSFNDLSEKVTKHMNNEQFSSLQGTRCVLWCCAADFHWLNPLLMRTGVFLHS